MRRRAIQLSAVLASALAVAVPVRAEQADTAMGVGLRIVERDRTTTGANPADDRNRSDAESTLVLPHGQAVAHGRRALIERTHDRVGRPVDVVTY